MTNTDRFRRVVLGMRHSAPGQGLRQATEFAALLRIELRGLFVKQEELSGLAALPFAREFRPLEGGWRALDQAEVVRDLEATAQRAQRLFADAAKGRNLLCEFEIVRGPIAEAISSVSRAGDILVLPEPDSPGERITVQFESMVQAALGSAASVLLVPERVARETGPVVAIVVGPQDPSIEAASAIAARANERLSILDAASLVAELRSELRTAPRPPVQRVVGGRNLHLSGVGTSFGPLRERLVVFARDVFDSSTAATIASIRRVPVLIVEPRQNSDEGVGA